MQVNMKKMITSITVVLISLLSMSLYSSEYIVFEKNKIKQYSDEKLVYFLSSSYINEYFEKTNVDPYEDIAIIVNEMIKRKNIPFLLKWFKKSVDDEQKLSLLTILMGFDDPGIEEAFKKYLNSDKTKINHYCLYYLAKKGNRKALKILNENFTAYPISSYEFSVTVKLFGLYKYKPAVKNLINGLDFASLNMVDACMESLDKIMNLKKKSFNNSVEAREYYTAMAEKLKISH